MKKILLFLTALFMIFATTGCVKYSYEINIDKNDKVTLSEVEAINAKAIESLIQSMGSNEDYNLEEEVYKNFDEDKKEFEEQGFKVEKYKDSGFLGYKKSKDNIKFENFSYILPKGFSEADGTPATVLKKKFCVNQHRIDLVYDIKKAGDNNEDRTSQFGSMNNYDNNYDDEYSEGAEEFGNAIGSMIENMPGVKPVSELTIKIPAKSKVFRHNATKVINDTEYQWDLASDDTVNIQLYYNTYDYSILIGIIGFITALALLALIYKKNTENVHI